MKQHEAVIEAMRANGGYATFGQLNQTVLKIPDCTWGTKTPFASIRRIVQTHDAFFRIRPGLWGLDVARQHVLAELGIAATAKPAQVEAFNHTYYQGLLVEIGNLLKHRTFVPPQDKNRIYLARKLGEICTLAALLPFTYDELLPRARTIDVTWFNERNFPSAFFEVEHSTDIQNSLLKFLEFQDFRTHFWIVADDARKAEVQKKLDYAAFVPIKSCVQFLSYERLAKWHTTESDRAAIVGNDSSLDTPHPAG